MKKKISAVVGYGAIGPIHAAAIEKSEFARLYAVCDTDSAALARAEAEHDGIRTFSSYDELLCDTTVDTVHICTPHFLHSEMLIKAHNAGKNVVVEKPAVMKAEEAESVRRVFSDETVKACAILQNRTNPCVCEMKRLIESGKYGAVRCAKGAVTWFRDKKYYESAEWRGKAETEGGGVVINQALHTLDLLRYLCGEFQEIRSNCSNRSLEGIIDVEDTAEAYIKTVGGAVVLFYATNAYPTSAPVEIEIALENAVLKYTHNRLFLIKDGEMREIASETTDNTEKWYWGKGHEIQIDGFYSALCGSGGEYPSLEEGLKAAEAVFGIYSSAQAQTVTERS